MQPACTLVFFWELRLSEHGRKHPHSVSLVLRTLYDPRGNFCAPTDQEHFRQRQQDPKWWFHLPFGISVKRAATFLHQSSSGISAGSPCDITFLGSSE